MLRQIIKINEEACNGCGICAKACHEGAIEIIEGKAKLVREHFCDGLGDCLPACPMGAITFEKREAPEYDEQAVLAAKSQTHICPGTLSQQISRTVMLSKQTQIPQLVNHSALKNWPVQLKLAPITAPYYQGASLLIAADCTAYTYAGFHRDFIAGRVTVIGCPKLDSIDYSEKLTEILRNNKIKDITLVRMEVPCCGGLFAALKKALQQSKKEIPYQVVTIRIDGSII